MKSVSLGVWHTLIAIFSAVVLMVALKYSKLNSVQVLKL